MTLRLGVGPGSEAPSVPGLRGGGRLGPDLWLILNRVPGSEPWDGRGVWPARIFLKLKSYFLKEYLHCL